MAEREIAGAGYVLTYFRDLESLTNTVSGYANLQIVIKTKYPGPKEMEEMNEADRARSESLSQNIHFWVNRTYIKYMGLKDIVKQFKEKETEVTELHKKILSQPMPEFELSQQYTLLQNQLFAGSMVSEILTRSREIYGQYFGQATEVESPESGPEHA